MLLRTITMLTLGLSLLVISCNDTTNGDLSNEKLSQINQSSQVSNLEYKAKKNSNSNSSTILEIAATNDDFSILAQAVLFAGLDKALDGRRQLTVLAPTNAAFAKLLAEGQTAEELLQSLGKETVKDILLYHVAPGKRAANAVLGSEQINTLLKKFIDVELDSGNLTVGNEENGYANVVATNVFASNGVIHVIDSVMLPPTSSLPPARK
ncbi:fasciclin domain-containing protein [Fodinibius sp.]|uniref:fasciclin domain-containing protein n=1 Tax=Fodinibius sp. TaxID=1872440 RepID=UPI002ACE2600|nr:fasciclin domain-containing protein [Fodinibius sp.]MDZ7659284.1 fasciclin domain-containing protein [Fodinibius sp.]